MQKLNDSRFTYVSLFSSAGVGCYGLSEAGLECVATVELIERRLQIQRYNFKCKYESGYIAGDLLLAATTRAVELEVERWRRHEDLRDLDLIVATPPCQGMSVANHKKNDADHGRNSLVVQSIGMVSTLRPRFFLFENVPAFMRTLCTDADGVDKPIGDAITRALGNDYDVFSRVINFKDFGASSSRTRSIVIGVRNDVARWVSPLELLPQPKSSPTLQEVIGHMRPLTEMGEIDEADFLHAFRRYPEHMRQWISGLEEGESAFENIDPADVPHQVIDGRRVTNQNKNGDKYRRQYWDRVGPCVHTRNDQLASQNTVHPRDDRVFSIRELMLMMTVPDRFQWFAQPSDELAKLPVESQRDLLKKNERCIRQSLGEAVPTAIMRSIGERIVAADKPESLRSAELRKAAEGLTTPKAIVAFIKKNPSTMSDSALSRIAELANSQRTSHAAYYTDRSLLTQIAASWPDLGRGPIRVLEPSVGSGNFIPFLIARYGDAESLTIDAVDVDPDALAVARALMTRHQLSDRVTINYVTADFLRSSPKARYDLVAGNPPFSQLMRQETSPMDTRFGLVPGRLRNAAGYFMLQALRMADHVSLIMPKYCLSTQEYADFRDVVGQHRIESIIDFGEHGFKGVLVETVCLGVRSGERRGTTTVRSVPMAQARSVRQDYITSTGFPSWLIYRDDFFDSVAQELRFGVFDTFRDRQVTTSMLTHEANGIPVLRSRNIDEDGRGLHSVPGYDAYIAPEVAQNLAVYRYLDRDDVYLAPNMTYKPRVVRKPAGVLVNGSVAILTPRPGIELTQANLDYFSSPEFRAFYRIARNNATRSMNIDSNSVQFFGIAKDGTTEC